MLIKMIPGIKFIEMTLNRLRVTCCDGGLLSIHSIELSIEIACEKRIREIKPLKTNFVVTACPTCYKNITVWSHKGRR